MLLVKKAGFFTTVQDLGRHGYRHLGVPVSGVSDRMAGSRVNSLLENDPADAMLECTMMGPVLEFEEPTYIAMSGGEMEAELNAEPIGMNQVYKVPAGSVLKCGHTLHGFRTYLGLKGGIESPVVLGSRSFFFPVTPEAKLEKRAALNYTPCSNFDPKLLKLSSLELYREEILACHPGPEYEWIGKEHRRALFGNHFTISKDYDRMACQLQESILPHSRKMITSATLPGTVQLTPAGRLIILMRDGQSTGGYPRILQLEERAINILSQKHIGDQIHFHMEGV
jgi:biotin-dependent carboxylase-like uncharacterized protein